MNDGYPFVSIQVVWDDAAQSMIRMIIEGSWTWEAMQDARSEVGVLLDMVPHEVTILLDLLKSRGLPNGYMWQFRRLNMASHPNAGPTVVITEDGLVISLAQMLNKLDGDKPDRRVVYTAPTLEDAQALARSLRAGAGT